MEGGRLAAVFPPFTLESEPATTSEAPTYQPALGGAAPGGSVWRSHDTEVFVEVAGLGDGDGGGEGPQLPCVVRVKREGCFLVVSLEPLGGGEGAGLLATPQQPEKTYLDAAVRGHTGPPAKPRVSRDDAIDCCSDRRF